MVDYNAIHRDSYVLLRDGQVLHVEDIADQDPFAYPPSGVDGEGDLLPVETIMIGNCNGIRVVTDLSEVARIIE